MAKFVFLAVRFPYPIKKKKKICLFHVIRRPLVLAMLYLAATSLDLGVFLTFDIFEPQLGVTIHQAPVVVCRSIPGTSLRKLCNYHAPIRSPMCTNMVTQRDNILINQRLPKKMNVWHFLLVYVSMCACVFFFLK